MRYEDVDWDLANCTGGDTDSWFPGKEMGGHVSSLVIRICGVCEIREDCLQYALDNDEVGVWGGRNFKYKKEDGNGSAGEVHAGGDGDDMPEVWSAAA